MFGSRSRALKDDIFGDASPAPAPAVDINVKSSNLNLNSYSNPIKIARKDATTLRVVSFHILVVFLILFFLKFVSQEIFTGYFGLYMKLLDTSEFFRLLKREFITI